MWNDVRGAAPDGLRPETYEQYVAIFDALSHPIRIKILGTLCQEKQYVSELARALNISRPLLYMHLKKLETAGLVTGRHEISDTGKTIKYCEAQAFNLQLVPDLFIRLSEKIDTTLTES